MFMRSITPGIIEPIHAVIMMPISAKLRCGLSRIYAVGNWLALTLTLSPRRGKAHWPRWDGSLISEGSAAFESRSLSPGERAGVRASVLRN